jgi:hypothetical protein
MSVKKWLIRCMLVGLAAAIALPILYFTSQEIWVYWKRTPDRERATATKIFRYICEEKRLDPADFDEPEMPRLGSNVVTFRWRVKGHPDDWILVNVFYFPYGVDYTESESIAARWFPGQPRYPRNFGSE